MNSIIKDFQEYKKLVNNYGWFNDGDKAEKLKKILIEKGFITEEDKFKKRKHNTGKMCICFRMIKNKTYPLFENEKLNPHVINNFKNIKWFNGKKDIIFDI